MEEELTPRQKEFIDVLTQIYIRMISESQEDKE